MKPSSGQLDLLGSAPATVESQDSLGLLGVGLDREVFLHFLTSEWLFPGDVGTLLLGVGTAYAKEGGISSDSVVVWFDVRKLPELNAMVFREERWSSVSLTRLRAGDSTVLWNGPLPLFAADHFSVTSAGARAHLLAMIRNFADMDVPDQEFLVETAESVSGPVEHPVIVPAMMPPRHWDALRGAAAMAVEAVPSIDPWLDLLCQSLSERNVQEASDAVSAPWWHVPLWSCDPEAGVLGDPLWRAIVGELSQPNALKDWRPRVVLERVCMRAGAFGEDAGRLARISEATLSLLEDRANIDEAGLLDDPLALTLQLLLLRPAPDRFATWREDLFTIPPGVWWTGMTLSGYLSGFRALPRQFRGSAYARKVLAIQTWRSACEGSVQAWHGQGAEKYSWSLSGDVIELLADKKSFGEHKLGSRGRWYRANFEQSEVRAKALEVARVLCPSLVSRVLSFEDTNVRFLGDGKLKVDNRRHQLGVTGAISFELNSAAQITERLDTTEFRTWLATATLKSRLPRLPDVAQEREQTPPSLDISNAWPEGLAIIPDFISESEERELLAAIDSSDWDTSMKRHVQHYGWRYEYKAKKVNPSGYIGPLPDWAQALAVRLYEQGHFTEFPDQVIVNQYIGRQGINKHIDCIPCFRGAVSMISLIESWGMVFSRESSVPGDALRVEEVLPRRSATVMSGPARLDWSHEIPARTKENGVPRGRRVSITFRKVNV